MKSSYDYGKEVLLYQNLLLERGFLSKIKQYRPEEYTYLCRSGLIILRTAGKYDMARQYYQLLPVSSQGGMNKLVLKSKIAGHAVQLVRVFKHYLKPITRIIKKNDE